MDNASTLPITQAATHLADRAALTADDALQATRQAANSALDEVSSRVYQVHAAVSPTLNRLVGPVDEVARRAREQPIQTLLMAAAAGAALMALLGLLRGR